MPKGFFETLENDILGGEVVWRCTFTHGHSSSSTIKIIRPSSTKPDYATLNIHVDREQVYRAQFELEEILKLIEDTASQLQATAADIKRFIAESPPPPQQENEWGR
ncbi:hypothetical protein [Phyllobacterium sp. 22552]|uniref:hypothetical protein n=1 Tax=Phyllobacterium sp. 22552 TaxID=3453941 RepID=UPI003F84B524